MRNIILIILVYFLFLNNVLAYQLLPYCHNNITEDTEEHKHEHTKDKFGGDIINATIAGAITGLTTAVGVYGSEHITNPVLGTIITSYTTGIGSNMSNVLLNGGNLKDTLNTGIKSLTDENVIESSITSGIVSSMTNTLTSQLTKGLSKKLLNTNIDNKFTTALKEATASTISNTTIESTLNGKSFREILKDQLTTSLVIAGANLATKEIGKAAHGSLDIDKDGNTIHNESTINKTEQLLLHGIAGATASKLLGNDMLSGAVSGVTGEVIGELLGENTKLSNDTLKEMGGLAGGLSAIITGGLQGLDESEISSNIFNGQRLGKNAVENNYVLHAARDLNSDEVKDVKTLLKNVFSSVGNHSFLVLVPDNPEDFIPEKLIERGIDTDKIKFVMFDNGKDVITVSGRGGTSIKGGDLVVSFNNEFDIKALNEFYSTGTEKDKTKWYKPDYNVESITIESNLNDTDFLYNILTNAQNYEKNTNNKITYKDRSKKQTILQNDSADYNLFPRNNKNEGNCNSFSNSILNVSGSTNQKDYMDIKGIDAGKNKKIDDKYFIKNGVNMNFY